MLKTVEEVQEKYPGIRLSFKWDPEKPVKEHGKGFIDMSGQKFNHLTVLEQFSFNANDKKSIWIVQCDCEAKTIFTTTGKNLRSGNTKSCGCAQVAAVIKKNTTHGTTSRDAKRSRIYNIYRDMLKKCYNPNKSGYSVHGAIGIEVCDKWRGEKGFENFLKWSNDHGYVEQGEDTPKNEMLTLVRIDQGENFKPSNCKWVSKSEAKPIRKVKK